MTTTPTDQNTQPDDIIVEVIEVLDPAQASAHDTTPGGEPIEVIEVIVIEPDTDTTHDPTADPTTTPDSPASTTGQDGQPAPGGDAHGTPTDAAHTTPVADHTDAHDTSSDDYSS